jgi:DNA repair exonuclease SbcCD ATPase subunit
MDIKQRLDRFWEALGNSYNIEDREYFEREAPLSGDWSPEEMALHHVWKRDPKVAELEQKLAAIGDVLKTMKNHVDVLETRTDTQSGLRMQTETGLLKAQSTIADLTEKLESWKSKAEFAKQAHANLTTAYQEGIAKVAELEQKLAEANTILEAWQSVFETSQLSHAKARLDAEISRANKAEQKLAKAEERDAALYKELKTLQAKHYIALTGLATAQTQLKRMGEIYPCKIKNGWEDAGRTGFVYGNIFLNQLWSVVVWDGDDDPSLHKSAGIER